ncbi:cryptochrome/photolyase family protein [Indioceanicola profundi]|uniref:cryptochrome/photolyase family protein n=1 Tax=Indioceanicola profundi TaxID=2220096 RepID=UPI000E6A9B77|nr:deoxyribodipyrimidine photo-lyase [Indioceanicola profundi]
MSPSPILLWFRQDLRLADNPALTHAVDSGRPVLPVFILDDVTPGRWRPGAASRWWLHHSLAALAGGLKRRGAPLILRRGPADAVIHDLAAETGAGAVVWNRCYEPWSVERDSAIKQSLTAQGIEAKCCPGSLLNEPWTILTGGGTPYRVFTPYWRAVTGGPEPAAPLPAPDCIPTPASLPASDTLCDWGLLPTGPDWASGIRESWAPGEEWAQARLSAFLEHLCRDYAKSRDLPALDGTSRLSPHLRHGEISPRQVWHAAMALAARRPDCAEGVMSFLREVVWRDFCYNLLYHFPQLPDRPLNPRFEAFPWCKDDKALAAWKQGRTGYPIVDAGLRQLWRTGWMHNRVRMIVGSVLVKHLLLPWQEGQDWFWDTLVDADLANNAAGWQWIAGCGADAAPYFRVFNPTLQGRKFDPDGNYVRRWVPELSRLPSRHIHAPWDAPAEVLCQAGVALGQTYPLPVVELGKGRERALAAYARIKEPQDE